MIFDVIRINVIKKFLDHKAKRNVRIRDHYDERRNKLTRLYSTWDRQSLKFRYRQLARQEQRLVSGEPIIVVACFIVPMFMLIVLVCFRHYLYGNTNASMVIALMTSLAFLIGALYHLMHALPNRINMELDCIMMNLYDKAQSNQ